MENCDEKCMNDELNNQMNNEIDEAMNDSMNAAKDNAEMNCATKGATKAAMDAATKATMDAAMDDAMKATMDDAMDDATNGATKATMDDAMDDATNGATKAAMDDAKDDAAFGVMDNSLKNTVEGCDEDGVQGDAEVFGKVVDIQELCDLLIDNGYRLIRVNRKPQRSVQLRSTRYESDSSALFGNNKAKSADGRLKIKSADKKSETKSADGRLKIKSTDVKSETKSADIKSEVKPMNEILDVGSVPMEMNPILEKELKWLRKKVEEMKFEAEINDPEMIKALKIWRRARAEEEKIPAYMVLPNIVLLRIAKLAPATQEELQAIPGFGAKLSQKYSDSLLSLIATIKEEVRI